MTIASSEIEMTRGEVVKSPRWSSFDDEDDIPSVYQCAALAPHAEPERDGTNSENGYNATD